MPRSVGASRASGRLTIKRSESGGRVSLRRTREDREHCWPFLLGRIMGIRVFGLVWKEAQNGEVPKAD